jgi:capsule biosynthesis phosphatase
MIRREKSIVLDVDGTICPIRGEGEEYADLKPYPEIVKRMREYRAAGFYIILFSSRNMNTYGGNIGLITANTAKTLLAWLDRHDVPYDEVHLGKPWPGHGGFYVDDKAIRPNEFLTMSYEQVLRLVEADEGDEGDGADRKTRQ